MGGDNVARLTSAGFVPMGYAGHRDQCPQCGEDDERWLCRSIDDRPEIQCMRCETRYVPKPRKPELMPASRRGELLEQESQCDCVLETQSCPECRAAAARAYPGDELPYRGGYDE